MEKVAALPDGAPRFTLASPLPPDKLNADNK